MKVIVNVVNVCNVEICPASEFVVSDTEDISVFKGRIAELNSLPFSDLELLKGGQPLRDAASVADCDIEDGATLMLKLTATDKTLERQLKDLLQDHTVDIEELGMLYVHSHGVPVSEALSALGRDNMRLKDFLAEHKAFQLQEGRVKAVLASAEECGAIDAPPGLVRVQIDPAPKQGEQQIQLSVCVRVMANNVMVEETTTNISLAGCQTIENAKNRIALAEMIPYASSAIELRNERGLLEDNVSPAEAGMTSGSSLMATLRATEEMLVEQLVSLLEVRKTMSTQELGMQYCYKHGVPAARALKLLGLRPNLKRFLESQDMFKMERGSSLCAARR